MFSVVDYSRQYVNVKCNWLLRTWYVPYQFFKRIISNIEIIFKLQFRNENGCISFLFPTVDLTVSRVS